MGSVEKKQANLPSSEKLVSVQTAELKEKLNRLYGRLKANAVSNRTGHDHFDSLWDLKELALLERRQSVDVPETWLAEVEDLDEKRRVQHGH